MKPRDGLYQFWRSFIHQISLTAQVRVQRVGPFLIATVKPKANKVKR